MELYISVFVNIFIKRVHQFLHGITSNFPVIYLLETDLQCHCHCINIVWIQIFWGVTLLYEPILLSWQYCFMILKLHLMKIDTLLYCISDTPAVSIYLMIGGRLLILTAKLILINHLDALVQHCSISSALAMEMLLSCTKPNHQSTTTWCSHHLTCFLQLHYIAISGKWWPKLPS